MRYGAALIEKFCVLASRRLGYSVFWRRPVCLRRPRDFARYRLRLLFASDQRERFLFLRAVARTVSGDVAAGPQTMPQRFLRIQSRVMSATNAQKIGQTS